MCLRFFRKKGISRRDAFNYLYEHHGMEFLIDCYDAEHTLSLDDAVDDLTTVCKTNGGDHIMVRDKIRVMMDLVTATVITCIMEDNYLPADEAMKGFYNSEVFDRLCDVETGLYRESGGYVYDLYKIELEHGRLVQLEI